MARILPLLPAIQWLGILVALAVFAEPSVVAAAELDYPIRPVPFTAVRIDGDFWRPRIETNRDITVWYDFKKCEETGRIDNFAVAGGLKPGGFQGIFFNDSDVFKVIEGAAYCLASQEDPKLDNYLDQLIAKIAAAQEDDGYLYTARTIADPKYNFPGREARWSNLRSGHELYNVGHLYEAAVAHHQATGKRTLLDVAIKNANLVCQVFGTGPGQRIDVPGHEEIEIGLVKLYRETGDEKYLQQARFFVDMRGRSDKRKTFGSYCQDHQPVVLQLEAVGHAVRAAYLYAGTADVAALTGEAAYVRAMQRIWDEIVSEKIYITGGIGASRHGEAFGGRYQLPNATAYNETCAAIGQALFSHRMFLLSGDAKYIDVLERILYNGFLSGIAISGDRFYYPNPLACDGRTKFNQGVLGRSPWFGCSCCPVNIVRFVPSIAGYVCAVRERDVYVNLYVGGTASVRAGQTKVTLEQQTNYPWDGTVRIRVTPEKEATFAVRLRIPGWVRGQPMPGDLYRYQARPETAHRITVNGESISASVEHGYAVIDRRWKSGDVVELHLPMTINRVVANELVAANRGRVAIERGPIVYCLEGVDHAVNVASLYLDDNVPLKAQHRADLLGGVTVLTGDAHAAVREEDGAVVSRPGPITMVPYYAWGHRAGHQMQVWISRTLADAAVVPAPTIASGSKASASHVWTGDSVAALNDLIEPSGSNDHDISRFTCWDHVGTTEWVQYVFRQPTEISSASVYWFDDTGRGKCRVPKSWRLLYERNGSWEPVRTTSPGGTRRDQFNTVTFKPVTASALRLEIQLQADFSAGILEWKVK